MIFSNATVPIDKMPLILLRKSITEINLNIPNIALEISKLTFNKLNLAILSDKV
ncbi:hypothetical protein SAMN05421825_2724 [Epilithonimonas hungarica]|uniref:Uncharacterized protein n=1 Tax=Epilithonimonas hungarica TaxID=454006 RepID=A0A1G7RND5_9FLAO|nr:hypothetical protein SAMN05421825_2724 [Epilithonimonas hungarica]